MSLYDSSIYFNDLKSVAISINFWDSFRDKSFLITGAAGLIASSVVDLLFVASDLFNLNIDVFVAGRNKEKMNDRFSKYIDSSKYHYVNYDATKSNKFEFKVDYIIHAAGNSYPSIYQSQPVETMISNFVGLYELLNYAKENGTSKLVYISSSEIYGMKETINPYKEDEYGYIDVLNKKSCYSNGKRAAETLCASFSDEYDLDTLIIRPGHIYGPTASRTDTRVSSLFAYDAADGKEIKMKSDGLQRRSYCYSIDTASAILTVLCKGKRAEAYNISDVNSVISIRKMAEILASAGNVNIIFENPSEDDLSKFNPMNNSSLNAEKLNSLGWRAIFNCSDGLGHTVRIIREAGL